jgi:HK97 family phage portal protein
VILATKAGNQKFALFDSSIPIPRPSQWGSTLSFSGERITIESAAGLAAFLRGVRLVAETAAGLPIMLSRGFGDDRKPSPKAPQLALLRRPNPDTSPFVFWSYLYTSLIRGNAYIYKVKVRQRPGGQVLKCFYPINPEFVTPHYEGSSVTFDIRDREYGPTVETVGRDKIIHIPGVLLRDPYVGVSIVEAHRNGLGTELGRQRFEGRYIQNDASPSVLLKHGGPGSPTLEQRQEIRAGYESRHAGANSAGRVGMTWGGWDVQPFPVSMADAQFIESKKYGVQEIARMLGVPGSRLGEPAYKAPETAEAENMKFLQDGLMPWMLRIEQAVTSDVDLFPESDWCMEFDTNQFLRADIHTRWDAYRLGRQGGWITANEIRSREGLPPADGGDEIQQTPVGGAANTTPSQDTGQSQEGGGANDANAAE